MFPSTSNRCEVTHKQGPEISARIINAICDFKTYGENTAKAHLDPRAAYIKELVRAEHNEKLVALMDHKLQAARKAVSSNGLLCHSIAHRSSLAFENATVRDYLEGRFLHFAHGNLKNLTENASEQAADPSAMINVVLRQMYRDWSPEAAEERDQAYGSVIGFLGKYFKGSKPSVLIPGAGLSYLAFALYKELEASAVDALEVSTHHLLALHWLNHC